jgi:plasmid maintenance system antidote protein VapI
MLNVVVLRQFLDATPMSQNEIARAMNIGQGLFSMKVNGQRRFSVPEAIKLAGILQLNFEDFKQIWRNA